MWLCGEASASKVNAPDVAMIREYAAATARSSEIDIALMWPIGHAVIS
jgi:hypothetical protein